MRRYFLILFLMMIPVLADAQPGRFRPEMMSDEDLIQMQTDDMAMWMNLKGSVKDRFIQEYSAFRKEIAQVAKSALPPEKTEDESAIEKALLNNFEVSEQILTVRKKYYHIFRKFLEPSQIRQMYHFENESGKRMNDGPQKPPRPDGHGGPGMPPEPPHHPGEPQG